MNVISRRTGPFRLERTTGIYGHLPKIHDRRVSYVGYLRLVTAKHLYTFWYMGNPSRHRIVERTRRVEFTIGGAR